jgi:hypothetical protein
MLDSDIAARVRQFLDSPAAQIWIDYAMRSCPKVELGKTDLDSYHASLVLERGWRSGLEFAQACARLPDPYPDYAASKPIDNTVD